VGLLMMREYSYFRAEGASLSAIETVSESKAELEAMMDKLCKKYGAVYASLRNDDNGRLTIRFLDFGEAKDAPDGWVIINRQMSNDGSRQDALLAKPAPGSPDAFHLASMAGLMERASRQSRLEGVFGCGDMPMRERPAGEYSKSFVRSSCSTALMNTPENAAGTMPDNTTCMLGSNSPTCGSDPLDAVKLDGSWYIRVPNKKGSEEPFFVPPDAVPIPYRRMLEIDSAENMSRFCTRPDYPPGLGW
jgi:hypothetical protein